MLPLPLVLKEEKLEQAENGLEKTSRVIADSLIVIHITINFVSNLVTFGFKSGIAKANEVLANPAKGMAKVITGYFDVNIDFRDARSVLQN